MSPVLFRARHPAPPGRRSERTEEPTDLLSARGPGKTLLRMVHRLALSRRPGALILTRANRRRVWRSGAAIGKNTSSASTVVDVEAADLRARPVLEGDSRDVWARRA